MIEITKYNLLKLAIEILEEVKDSNEIYASRLRHTSIRWSDRLTATAGRASERRNLIELSWPIFKREDNQHGFRNTVLHEIAHIIAGDRAMHNRIWRHTCIKIGRLITDLATHISVI